MNNNSLAGGYKDGYYIISSIRKGSKFECKPWANEDFVYIPMYDHTVGAFYFEIDKKLFTDAYETKRDQNG